MNKLALILATGLLISTGKAQACKDTWQFTQDKQKHFAVSFALGAGARLVTEDTTAAFLLGLAPGVLKEIADARDPANHCASLVDLAYDALGVAVGVAGSNWVIRHNFVGYRTSF